VWCWGYGGWGILGRGTNGNSSFARQVKADVDNSFGDVAEISVGQTSACARKLDGTIWCWGNNSAGQLGVDAGALAWSFYPVKVPITGTVAQKTATRLITTPWQTFCAVMQNTSVVCWGANAGQQAGAPAAASVGPTTIVNKLGGSALTGVADVTVWGGGNVCARTSSGDVLCWGEITSSPYPQPAKDAADSEISGLKQPITGGVSLSYIAANGQGFIGGSPASPQPPCVDP